MKNAKIKKLALFGIAGGVLLANQPELLEGQLLAVQDEHVIDLEHTLAKPKCKAHGGCGGLTASRDLNAAAIEDDEDLEDEESSDEEEDAILV